MTKEPVKIFVNECILEITERCNMHCQHCIRGNAGTNDIDPRVITKLLKTAIINGITFSGGEPALNIPAIRDYFRKAEKYNNFPSYFYVVTNGTVNQRPLSHALMDAYAKCGEPELCGLAVSKDIFHDAKQQDDSQFLGLYFYNEDDHSHPENEYMPQWVINDGNAAVTGWGERKPRSLTTKIDDVVDDYSHDPNTVYIDQIYVTVDGLVVSDCDASRERMKNEYICHVNELQDVVRDYIKRRQATRDYLSYKQDRLA